VMGASWISWRTTLSFIPTALTSVKTVTGVEGQTLSFRCEYSHELWNNTKYFNRDDEEYPLIRTDKHDQWERNGRFSLYDNTTGAFIIIQVDKVVPEDSGIYLCGVDLSLRTDRISKIQLNVPRGTVCRVTAQDQKKLKQKVMLKILIIFSNFSNICFFCEIYIALPLSVSLKYPNETNKNIFTERSLSGELTENMQ
uniref:Ig-like domain-containing protein n=1 Tax=Seriola lalandi dorsalis TaxID=1841481 RepID=A0A3B4XSZ1_SERLL